MSTGWSISQILGDALANETDPPGVECRPVVQPAFTFSNDPNVGWYYGGLETFSFSAHGVHTFAGSEPDVELPDESAKDFWWED